MQVLQTLARDSKVAHVTRENKQLQSLVDELLPIFQWLSKDVFCIGGCSKQFSVSADKEWRIVLRADCASLRMASDTRGDPTGPTVTCLGEFFHFEFGGYYQNTVLEYTCSRALLKMVLQRLEALDVPMVSDANRAQLRQFLDAAAQLLD